MEEGERRALMESDRKKNENEDKKGSGEAEPSERQQAMRVWGWPVSWTGAGGWFHHCVQRLMKISSKKQLVAKHR